MTNTVTSAKALMLACLIASACSPLGPIPDRSRFFTLNGPTAAPTDPSATAGARSAGGGQIVYGLGPIVLPPYLDRTQIATRISPTEVAYSQWDRWAEPLAANVSSVLLQTLSSDLGTDDIVLYPWPGGAEVEYQIAIRLLRFETDATGESHLRARWSVRDVRRDRHLAAKETTLTRPGRPDDRAGSTAALSGMLGDLGHEIATTIRELPASSPAPTPAAAKRRKRAGT
jgi:uncharacterized lipoprotein YmbA